MITKISLGISSPRPKLCLEYCPTDGYKNSLYFKLFCLASSLINVVIFGREKYFVKLSQTFRKREDNFYNNTAPMTVIFTFINCFLKPQPQFGIKIIGLKFFLCKKTKTICVIRCEKQTLSDRLMACNSSHAA